TRRSCRGPRGDDRARDVRPAELARDPALHAPARSRSRGTAAEDCRRARGGTLPVMRLAVSLRLANESWDDASQYVVEAERLGIDYVWSAEAWGHDAATPLAFVAARTSRIRIGTAITHTGTRTPPPDALTAARHAAVAGARDLPRRGAAGR